ncbi:MAG: GNAT family N-acetyltransferase [Chloroflexi bacterium]|nr:GNAT family N-acetyltransferase [Chloroflexota bacterium]
MSSSIETPYQQAVGDGLILRTAANECDVERVAEFNGSIHGPEIVSMTHNLFIHHPNTKKEDLIFVEDEKNDQIVSSLCLIPWTWRYENVEIPTGEMGIVGTLEEYRHRGLVRAQVEYFKRRLGERGCLLSQIQGIPYYYRQFGYEYALPLEGGLRLEIRYIPAPSDDMLFTFRLATLQDVPTLMQLYDEASQDLTISATRDKAIWRYLLTHSKGTEPEQEIWIIEDAENQGVGYVCVPKHHFGEELVASEVSQMGYEAATATMHHLKTLTVERKKPGIRFNLPANCTLMQLARSFDAYDMGTYAWQIHVPNFAALLRTLIPVFERRVAGSPFAGLTKDAHINLYHETIRLHFKAGKLVEVASLGFVEGRDIRVPPLQFVPLILGYRSVKELQAVYPDVSVEPPWRLLADTLFPQVTSFIQTIY